MSTCVHCGGKLDSLNDKPETTVSNNSNDHSNTKNQEQSDLPLLTVTENEYETVRQRVAVLNVGGLLSKLKFPEFDDLLVSCDIICLTETKLDYFDSIDIPNFTCFRKNRLHYKRKSGGIAVLIRNELTKCIKIIENIEYKKYIDETLLQNYKFVSYPVYKDGMFLELPYTDKGDPSKRLYLCTVYNPPENSPYVNFNCFNELEETLLNMDAESVILTGDFNARTGEMNDFLDRDDILDDTGGDITIIEQMKLHNINIKRKTMDRITNNFGHKLIDFCISQELLLLNGRKDFDAGIGKVTCRNISVVDYVITKPYLFKSLTNFSIGEFCECISDVHSAIYFDLIYDKSSINSEKQKDINVRTDENKVITPKWKAGIDDLYLKELDDSNIENVRISLNEVLQNAENIDQNKIDILTASVTDIMSEAAKKIGIIKPVRKKYIKRTNKTQTKKNSKEWFNKECAENRAALRNLRLRVKANEECADTKRKRNEAYKKYKRSLTRNYNLHIKNLQNKIRNMKSTDTKNYWKLINGNARGKKNYINEISREAFAKHFESLCNVPSESLKNANIVPDEEIQNLSLNVDITEEEVLKCIKKLKNNKACGYDGILNEFIKCSGSKLISIITMLFNVILTSGKIPITWTIGYISPIYKGKGPANDPDNYRGITIVSCFGKLFTSILNERIRNFLEENLKLGNEQAGFRKGHSTLDHIFALHCLIDLYLRKKKKLYCAFVDFRKAFDSVQHSILWGKIQYMNVCGKVLDIVRDMYDKTKLCVKHMGTYSNFFVSNIGLLQGENLSPILFSMFINDLRTSLCNNDINLQTLFQTAKSSGLDQIEEFMHLFLLLYADDTAILAETPENLQKALDNLAEYCDVAGLKVNVDKTKIVIFSRGRTRNIPVFFLNNINFEVLPDYVYLGVLFNFNNKYQKAQNRLCQAGNRAMFSLLKKCRKLNLPIDTQLDLFDKCIHPVITYGCEIWGYESLEQVLRFQKRFLKLVLGANKSTPSCMILGETGCYPIHLEIQSRLLVFWYKLMRGVSTGADKLSCILLSLQLKLFESGEHTFLWLKHVHTCLNNLGLTFLWHTQSISENVFKNMVKQRLKDQYIQTWTNEINMNNICYNYRMFKTEFKFEQYLINLERPLRDYMLKFRLSNHKLPIHSQRFLGIRRDERLCEICETGEIGDEFHYLFNCRNERIVQERIKNLNTYFLYRPNVVKYQSLMNAKSKVKQKKLARFFGLILSKFR